MKKFIRLAIPVLLTNLLQQLYNAVDIMVIGRFADKTALAAVSSTGALTHLIINLFIGFAAGANVTCARCYGSGDKEGLSKTIHTAFTLAVVLGIPLAVIGWISSAYFLGIMGTPEDVIDKAALYMKIYFLGAPASLIYNYGAAMLRAVGDTKKPLYILGTSGLVNVCLNFVCVVGFGMDVEGVAIGTIAAQYVSAVAVAVIYIKTDSEMKLSLKKMRIYKKEIKQIAFIGVPAGLNSAMFSLSNVILQSSVNSFGSTVMAANGVAVNYSNFAYIIVAAGEQACVSFVGQNMGAKKFDRLGKAVRTSLLVTAGAVAVYSLVVGLNGRFFLGLFNSDPVIVETGMAYIYTVIFAYALIVPSVVLGGALGGMGKAYYHTIISLVFICLTRVLWVTFVLPLKNEYLMVFLSYPVSWILAGSVAAVVYIMTKRRMEKIDVAG